MPRNGNRITYTNLNCEQQHNGMDAPRDGFWKKSAVVQGKYLIGSPGTVPQKIVKSFKITPSVWVREPNYESFADCLSFWRQYGYIGEIIPDHIDLKTLIYNLTAIKKYCAENEISDYYRGVSIGNEIFAIVRFVTEESPIRIKDPEKFFKFAVDCYVDAYYALSEHEDMEKSRVEAILKTTKSIIKILNTENPHGEEN